MRDDQDSLNHDSEASLPKALRTELAEFDAPGFDVPKRVDERILSGVRARFTHRRRMRLVTRLAPVAVAAAAAVVFAVLLNNAGERRHAAPPGSVVVKENQDIDRNGRVDILDAFVLARRIESAEALEREWDVNGDGNVDSADVDTIAMAAVSLEKGSF